MSLLQELKRRNVVRVAAAYAIVGWLIIQIATALVEPLSLPDWFDTVVIVLLLIGFPVALLLAWAYELTPEGIKRTPDAPGAAGGSDVYTRRLDSALIALLVIAIAFIALDNFVFDQRGERENADSVTTTEPDRPVLAVLPFSNIGGTLEANAFALGLHDEVIRQLRRQFPSIIVVDRGVVMAYADSNQATREIALDLGADFLVLGTIRSLDGQIYANLDLYDTATDALSLLSTERRSYINPFDLQAEIARNVGEELRIDVSGTVSTSDGLSATTEAAYDHYVRGVGFFLSGRGLDQAIVEYEAAINEDPTFAPAYARLENAYRYIAIVAPGRASEALAKRAAVVSAAFAAVPNQPETQVLRARVYEDARNWRAAEDAYLAIVEGAGSGESENGGGYGEYLMRLGRASDALVYAKRSRQANPTVVGLTHVIAIIYDIIGEHELAFEEYETARALGASGNIVLNQWHRYRLAAAGDYAAALENLSATDPNPEVDTFDERMFRALGNRSAALEILRQHDAEVASQAFAQKGEIALWAAHLDEPTFAIRALEESIAVDNFWLAYIWVPFARPLHSTPEFKEFLMRLGMPEYWRESGRWPDHCRARGATDFECF